MVWSLTVTILEAAGRKNASSLAMQMEFSCEKLNVHDHRCLRWFFQQMFVLLLRLEKEQLVRTSTSSHLPTANKSDDVNSVFPLFPRTAVAALHTENDPSIYRFDSDNQVKPKQTSHPLIEGTPSCSGTLTLMQIDPAEPQGLFTYAIPPGT